MDKKLVIIGPKLFCEYCGEKEVLSPCLLCQRQKSQKKYCRGCGGRTDYCEKKLDICWIFAQEKLLTQVELSFYNQNLTHLPVQMRLLKNLRSLDLSHNQLTKLPRDIEKLANLTHLLLEKNHLTQLPEELGQLAHLKFLSIRDNQLTQLPSQIENLTHLKLIDIRNNPFTLSEVGKIRKALPNCCVLFKEE